MARFPNIPTTRRIQMNQALATYDEAAVMEDQPRYAMDKKLHVTFHLKAVRNEFKSNQEGRPIFDEVDYVRIIIPGDTKTINDVKVTEEHKVRFREKYRAYKEGQVQAQSGTPLEVWPQMTVGQVAELKAMHVTTVEQLADMPDQLAQQIMGSHALRAKAKAFLEAAAGEAVNTKLQAELSKRDNEIALLKAQMEQIAKAQSAQKAATK
jgi:hypothetical protein